MIKLNQQLKQLELSKVNIANEIVFEYFDKKVAAGIIKWQKVLNLS